MAVRLLCVVESEARMSTDGVPDRCRSVFVLVVRNARWLDDAVLGVLMSVPSDGTLPVAGSVKDRVSVAPPEAGVSEPDLPTPLLERWNVWSVVFGIGQLEYVFHTSPGCCSMSTCGSCMTPSCTP